MRNHILVDSHNHRPRRVELLPQVDFKTTALNREVVKHSLVIGLAKSFDTRMKIFLENCPVKNIEVIEAVDGSLLPKVPEGVPLNQGDLGCLLSHLKALEYAKEKGWKSVMIFEDDAVFVEGFNDKLKKAMMELPENWDMLWLAGSNFRQPYPFSANLKRLVASWGTYGYVIRDSVYDVFINLFKEEKLSSDDYFRRNHSKYFSFRTAENLVTHAKGKSDREVVNHFSRRITI